ncbi:MAG: sugar ABC transporter permease [Faecalibacterium sp.]|jgi:multiple sugar transport system permease protein|nr:sugar ABC transporter permease [Faecalibacterium sp.]
MKEKTQKSLWLRLKPQTRTDITGYGFLLPNLIGSFLFTFLPVVFSLVISFTDWDYTKGIGNWNVVGIKNYIDMWSDEWFRASLLNTLIFTVAVVPITIFLALVLGVLIDKYCFGKLPIRLAMLMPYISNCVAVAIVWVMMYSSFGPVTQLCKLLGIQNVPQWLADYKWALPAVILMTIWSNVGYSTLIYTSAIQALPQDVYEAADIDGAGALTRFFRLTVPLLSPTTFFLIITNIITSFQVFAPIQIMTRGGPGTSTYVLVYYIYTSAFSYYKMGYASAMAWILFILIFIVTMIQWRGQKKWVGY